MRSLFVLTIFVGLLSLSTSQVSASLIEIMPDGEVSWKVLGVNTQEISITKVGSSDAPDAQASVSLTQEGGRSMLTVVSNGETKMAEITNFNENVVEFKRQQEAEKMSISAVSDGFIITQNNLVTKTLFPIIIDPKSQELSVETPTGKRLLSILPQQAYSGLEKTNIIDRMQGEISLLENEQGQLAYVVSGEKVLDILHITQYPVPVSATVSATSGEVLSIVQPFWLPLVSFLIS